MVTMNISLPAPMKAWVEEQAFIGRYGNSSDVVRDVIRREQDRTLPRTDPDPMRTFALARSG